jgi:hypothetical protein
MCRHLVLLNTRRSVPAGWGSSISDLPKNSSVVLRILAATLRIAERDQFDGVEPSSQRR